MKKGDIFWATDKSKHQHPIVFLKTLSEGRFSACILSSKVTEGNVKMSENDFLKKDEDGKKYVIVFNNSHLVPDRVFEKDEFWLSSKIPKGRLSESGIELVEKYTNGISSEYHPFPIWDINSQIHSRT
jgi:hypothetical protein